MDTPEKTITPGLYTFKQVFETVGFSMDGITDYRTVKVGGLGFDNPETDTLRIPEGAEKLEITLNGSVVVTATVLKQ